MNIDPCAGIGGAYVIDPKTGERVLASTLSTDDKPLIDDKVWNMLDTIKYLKEHQSDNNEPIDPIAA